MRANDTASIPGQLIKLDVYGATYIGTTDTDGYVTQPLNLVAVGGEATTYQIRAVFEGAGFQTSNLTITDPYGHDYIVCTTLQWDLKSSQNSASLTVEAPKTDATVSTPASPEDDVTVTQTPETTTVSVPPPKTPEQMQQEAEQSGWITTWHEFNWWFPWYRLHIVYNLNGQKQFDAGIGCLGGSVIEAFEEFRQRIDEYTRDIALDVLVDYILGEVPALVGSVSGDLGFWMLGLTGSTLIKLGLLLFNWGSVAALRTSYVAQWISIMMEVGAFVYQFLLDSLLKIAQGLVSITQVAWNIITIAANVIVDVAVFLSIIDGRLAELSAR